MDFAIVCTIIILNYAFLKSHGSKGDRGLSIKAQLAPMNTPEGKRDRMIGGGVFAVSIAAFAFIFMRQPSNSRLSTIAVPTILGAAVFLGSYLMNRE